MPKVQFPAVGEAGRGEVGFPDNLPIGVRCIRVSYSKFALLDEPDFQVFSRWNWYVDNDGYVKRSFRKDGKKRNVYLHREIAGNPVGLEVHHKNEDKLDCRRGNLETKTPAEHKSHHAPRLVDWCAKHRWHRTKFCVICGKEFQPNPKRIKRHKCCSPECSQKAREESFRKSLEAKRSLAPSSPQSQEAA